jgi:hypothetical protein
MKKSLLTLVLPALAAASFAVSAPTATAASPVEVDFVKHATDPTQFVFGGTVSGGVSGGLTSRLVSLDAVSGPVYHVTFEWSVSAGAMWFTARTSGIWNTLTGSVVMDGRVIAGYLDGAQVHEEGQLVDPSTLTFAGFLRLLPDTAA